MTRLMITEETQRLAMQWLMEHGSDEVLMVHNTYDGRSAGLAFSLQATGYLSHRSDPIRQAWIFQMTPEGLKQLKDFDAGN